MFEIVNGKKYISLREIAKLTNYHRDYIGQLIRKGELPAQKIGNAWFVADADFEKFLSSRDIKISSEEIEISENSKVSRARGFEKAKKILAILKPTISAVFVFALFAMYFSIPWFRPIAPSSDVARSIQDFKKTVADFDIKKVNMPAQYASASLSELFNFPATQYTKMIDSISNYILGFFPEPQIQNFIVYDISPAPTTTPKPISAQGARLPDGQGSTSGGQIINSPAKISEGNLGGQATTERFVPADYTVLNTSLRADMDRWKEKVSQDFLLSLGELKNQLTDKINSSTQANFNAIALSQPINNLGPVTISSPTISSPTITNVTVTNVTGLTDADIPDAITVTGTQSFTTLTTSAGIYSSSTIQASDNILGYSLLGIGTTSPSQALSVHGNGLFSGDLSVANITATGTMNLSGLTTLTNASTSLLSVSDTAWITSKLFVATTSSSNSMAVHGNGLISGDLSLANLIASGTLAVSGTATSTFANGIQLSSGCFLLSNGECAVSLSNINSSFAWTPTTNFAQLANSTSTQLWLKGSPISISASSTSIFDYASTTAFTVSGNSYFPSGIWNSSGSVGIGNDTMPLTTYRLYLEKTSTETSAGLYKNLYISMTHDPASASDSTLYGIRTEVSSDASNAQNLAAYAGIRTQSEHLGSGLITTVQGSHSIGALGPANTPGTLSGIGTATNVMGALADAYINNSNTETNVTTVAGQYMQSYNYSAGTATNLYGFHSAIGLMNTSGAVTNMWGGRIRGQTIAALDTLTGGTVDNAIMLELGAWTLGANNPTYTNPTVQLKLVSDTTANAIGIQQLGTNPNNRFQGNTRIGADSVPDNTLSVTGTADFTDKVGIGTTSPWRTFSVNGTASFVGLTTNTGGVTSSLCLDSNNEVTKNTQNENCVASSARFKHDIESLATSSALTILQQLRPVTFEYNKLPGTKYGFIAEEVQKVDDLLVSYDDEGLVHSVRYTSI